MSVKIIVNNIQKTTQSGSEYVARYAMSENGNIGSNVNITFPDTGIVTDQNLVDYISDDAIFWASQQGPYSLTRSDVLNAWECLPRTYVNNPSRSIVTGTGATGFQVNANRKSKVQYSPTMATTASISGNASDVIVLEICATNSATAGDWKEIGRLTNAQALSLAITLQSVQTTSGVLAGEIPAGWYAKMRAITSGTVSNTFVSGQEVLL